MVLVKKTNKLLLILAALISAFSLGIYIGRNQYNKIPNNIQIDAKALIKEILIKEININGQELTITFDSSINEDMNELIESKIISTIYEIPVSGQILMLNNQIIELVYIDSEYRLDLSKDSSFTLTFRYKTNSTDVITEDSFQSVDITFKMSQDPMNIYEYIASYIYQ